MNPNPNYNDDPNQQLLPPSTTVVQPQSGSSFMDYVRDHKLAVAIIIIIIIALIWWFFFRKNNGAMGSTTTSTATNPSGSNITVQRSTSRSSGTLNPYPPNI